MPGAAPAQQDGEPPEAAGPAEREGTAEPEPSEPSEPVEATAEAAADDGPRPLGLHVEPTGHAPVDAELRRLEDADHLAVSGHLEVYEDVHSGLREALAGLDRQGTPGPGPTAAPGPAPVHRPVPGPQHPRS
jgi:hypothetical protein